MTKIRILALLTLFLPTLGSLPAKNIGRLAEIDVEAAGERPAPPVKMPVAHIGWLEAHEWGVQEYVWNPQTAKVPLNLPEFVHTRKDPGIKKSAPRPLADQNVRVLKPLLYFRSSLKKTKIDVQLGFRDGDPIAWYPQADEYSPAPFKLQGAFRGRIDPAMAGIQLWQLAWHNLELTSGKNGIPAVEDADHWIHKARNVDAMTVRNTKGASERYLFYEGDYSHEPDFAVRAGRDGAFDIVNTSPWPLHQVAVVVFDKKNGIFGYTRLNILKQPGQGVAVLPYSGKPKVTFKTGAELSKAMRSWMESDIAFESDLLIAGDAAPKIRDHQLRPDEAKSLFDIWQKDLFEYDGLSVVYRRDRAHVDHRIPLKITAERGVEVKIRRCGLVFNRDLPLETLVELGAAVDRYCADEATKEDLALLKQERRFVLPMVRGEIGLGKADDSRLLHLQRLQALLNLN